MQSQSISTTMVETTLTKPASLCQRTCVRGVCTNYASVLFLTNQKCFGKKRNPSDVYGSWQKQMRAPIAQKRLFCGSYNSPIVEDGAIPKAASQHLAS